jgi:RNA recognition motif
MSVHQTFARSQVVCCHEQRNQHRWCGVFFFFVSAHCVGRNTSALRRHCEVIFVHHTAAHAPAGLFPTLFWCCSFFFHHNHRRKQEHRPTANMADSEPVVDATTPTTPTPTEEVSAPESAPAPAQAKAYSARVYVGNLDYAVTSEALGEHMAQAGAVISAEVMKTYSGRSKGCGVVEFGSLTDAQNAISTLNDTHIIEGGRMVFIREDREDSSLPAGTFPARAPRQRGGRRGGAVSARGGARGARGPRGPRCTCCGECIMVACVCVCVCVCVWRAVYVCFFERANNVPSSRAPT